MHTSNARLNTVILIFVFVIVSINVTTGYTVSDQHNPVDERLQELHGTIRSLNPAGSQQPGILTTNEKSRHENTAVPNIRKNQYDGGPVRGTPAAIPDEKRNHNQDIKHVHKTSGEDTGRTSVKTSGLPTSAKHRENNAHDTSGDNHRNTKNTESSGTTGHKKVGETTDTDKRDKGVGNDETHAKCDTYCEPVNKVLTTLKHQLKEYVDQQIARHEQQDAPEKTHIPSENHSTAVDYDNYLTREQAANIFLKKSEYHSGSGRGSDHTKKTSNASSSTDTEGSYNLTEIKRLVQQHDLRLAKQVQQYLSQQPSVKGVRSSLHHDLRNLAYQMRDWAESTFARKSRVQQLEHRQMQLQKQVDYLQAAVGPSDVNVSLAARVMAAHDYHNLTYGGTTCRVYQKQYFNQTGPKVVQCVR